MPPSIWGGDPACEHEWGEDVESERRKPRSDDIEVVGSSDGNVGRGPRPPSPATQFCIRCNAWRGELGLEPTPDLFVSNMVSVFREVRRVLRDDGTLWVNIGDSYAASGSTGQMEAKQATNKGSHSKRSHRHPPNGFKPKDLCGIPWALAFAMRSDGWYLRSEIIWCKTSPMPESVTDRPTSATEKIFLFTKLPRYFYDQDAERVKLARPEELDRETPAVFGGRNESNGYGTRKHSGNEYTIAPEGGRNLWNYWTDLRPCSYPDAHFATFPPDLPKRCINLGTSAKGCCAECGAPYVRVVERGQSTYSRIKSEDHDWRDMQSQAEKNGTALKGGAPACGGTRLENGTMPHLDAADRKMTGWQPSCECGHGTDVEPCVVLDPFSGSGTTGMVATEMGRRYIGIELSPDYAEMSARRIDSWKHRDVPTQPKALVGQKQMF